MTKFNRMGKAVIALLGLVLLAACTSQPVNNPTGRVPVGRTGNSPDMAEIGQAIAEACRVRKWTASMITKDRVHCEITVRGRHQAQIDIEFGRTSYRINYQDSEGLNYKNGNIHRNYNKWVILLSRTIDQKLNEIGSI